MKLRTVLFVVVLLAFTGCARSCGKMAYRNHIHQEVQRFEHTAEPEAIWAETLALLDQHGAEFSDTSLPTDRPRLSKWEGPRGRRSRFSVRIVPSGDTSRLYIHWIDEMKVPVYEEGAFDDPNGPPPKPIGHRYETVRRRDTTLEWEVVQRLAPVQAMEIERAALEREEVVRDVVANGCM